MLITCLKLDVLAAIYVGLIFYAAYRSAPGAKFIRDARFSTDAETRRKIPDIPYRVDAGGRSSDWALTRFIYLREYKDFEDKDVVRRLDATRFFGTIFVLLCFFLIPVLAYPEVRQILMKTICN